MLGVLAGASEDAVVRAATSVDVTRMHDAQFIEMLRAFRKTGGLMREGHGQSQWPTDDGVVQHRAQLPAFSICVTWERSVWIPRFQFDGTGETMRPEVEAACEELRAVLDPWELALWWASPNLWIGDARPVDLIDRCERSVLGAARADRFIATG